jgi:YesN/AraC family two-component response regulator
MSNLENENNNGMESPKKRPYNLREKKKKDAAYRNLIRPQLADELYKKIVDIVVKQKKYKDADYSAKDLAKDLNINTRYLSAVINSRFGENYSCLHNKYRIEEALKLLADIKLARKNIEEVSAMVGFSNRQSFYASFYKYVGETPNGYRKRMLDGVPKEEKDTKKKNTKKSNTKKNAKAKK